MGNSTSSNALMGPTSSKIYRWDENVEMAKDFYKLFITGSFPCETPWFQIDTSAARLRDFMEWSPTDRRLWKPPLKLSQRSLDLLRDFSGISDESSPIDFEKLLLWWWWYRNMHMFVESTITGIASFDSPATRAGSPLTESQGESRSEFSEVSDQRMVLSFHGLTQALAALDCATSMDQIEVVAQRCASDLYGVPHQDSDEGAGVAASPSPSHNTGTSGVPDDFQYDVYQVVSWAVEYFLSGKHVDGVESEKARALRIARQAEESLAQMRRKYDLLEDKFEEMGDIEVSLREKLAAIESEKDELEKRLEAAHSASPHVSTVEHPEAEADAVVPSPLVADSKDAGTPDGDGGAGDSKKDARESDVLLGTPKEGNDVPPATAYAMTPQSAAGMSPSVRRRGDFDVIAALRAENEELRKILQARAGGGVGRRLRPAHAGFDPDATGGKAANLSPAVLRIQAATPLGRSPRTGDVVAGGDRVNVAGHRVAMTALVQQRKLAMQLEEERESWKKEKDILEKTITDVREKLRKAETAHRPENVATHLKLLMDDAEQLKKENAKYRKFQNALDRIHLGEIEGEDGELLPLTANMVKLSTLINENDRLTAENALLHRLHKEPLHVEEIGRHMLEAAGCEIRRLKSRVEEMAATTVVSRQRKTCDQCLRDLDSDRHNISHDKLHAWELVEVLRAENEQLQQDILRIQAGNAQKMSALIRSSSTMPASAGLSVIT
eukprot:Rmarinus@m.15579